MSHPGNDEVYERIATDVSEMSHREKVMTLLEFFYDSGLWIRMDTWKRLDTLDNLLTEVLFTTHPDGP
jgi:hypothetical protein